MSGGGSMAAMNQSIRENNALRNAKKNRFKANNRKSLYSSKEEESLKFKTVTEEELAIINAKNLQKIKRDERTKIISFIISIIVFGVIAYFILK